MFSLPVSAALFGPMRGFSRCQLTVAIRGFINTHPKVIHSPRPASRNHTAQSVGVSESVLRGFRVMLSGFRNHSGFYALL